MDNAIKGFCDYVSRQGQVDLEYCGINENNEFFYNHQVAPAPRARRRLIDGMKKHSQLIHLANRVVITRADVAAYYSSPSVPQQGGYSLQATGYGYSASIGGVAYRPLMPAASAPYAGSLGTSYSPFTPPTPSLYTGGLRGTLSSPLMPTPATNAGIRGESPAVMFTPAPQANLYPTFASASTRSLLPSSTGAVYQNAEYTSARTTVLPGSVIRIDNLLGIGQFIEHLDPGATEPYGIVNSIDESGELQAGVAKDIKRVVGSNYERVIRDRQTGVHGNCRVSYGECFTYDCSFNSWSKPQKLNNCRLVLNVLVPFSVNPKFDLHLKNSILKVLEEAAQYGINRLYFPLLGCGRAGGNGRQLAKAIYEAKRDFESCNDQKAPKIFLVSRGNPSDKRTCVDFDVQWNALMAPSVPSSTPSSSARRSKSPAPSRASSGAAANASSSGAELSSRPRPVASLSPVASTPSTSRSDSPVSIKRDTAQTRGGVDARSQTARRSKSPAPSRASSGSAANASPSGAGLSSRPRPAASLSPVASTPSTSRPDSPVSVRRDTNRARGDADARPQTARRSKSPAPSRASSGSAANASPSGAGLSSRPRPAASLSPVASTPSTSRPDSPVSVRRDTNRARGDADARPQTTRRPELPTPSRASSGAAANASPSSEAELPSRSRPSASSVASTLSTFRPDSPVSARRDTARARGGADARSQATRRPELPTHSRASSGAAASSGTTEAIQDDSAVSQKVLISDQLEIVMHPKGGMFGYAKELSSRGEAFDLVNAANGHMAHNGGIAYQFKKDLGSRFEEDTKKLAQRRPEGEVPTGQCITTGAYDYAENQSLGLINCQHIHHVVAPMRRHSNQQEYDKAFKEAFVSLLLAANENGGNTIVSCFIGCAVFGGSGHDMACALHAAYHDSRVTSLSKVPKLILSGWEKTDSATIGDDRRVYDDFIQTFEALNAEKPVHLPSGITPAASSTDISETAFPAGAGAIQKAPSSRPSASSVASTLSTFRPDSPVSARRDTARADADWGRVVPRAQSSFEPRSRVSYVETSLGSRVELVKSNRGIEDYVRLQYFEGPYGVVNSIDKFGRLQGGVAKAIGNIAGDRYAKTICEMQNSDDPSEQLGYGQCVTYELKRSEKTSDLEKLQTVHSVLIPFSEDPNFDAHLKDSILRVFEEAVQHELDLIIFPLLGCGKAGGTGGQLARAVYAAMHDFKSRAGKEAPKMVLVGSNSLADQKIIEDFKCECSVIAPAHNLVAPNTRRAGSAVPFRASSGAAANTSPSKEELPSRSRPSASSVASTLSTSKADSLVSTRRDTARARGGADARSQATRRPELPTHSKASSGAAASSGTTTEAIQDDSAVSQKVLISDQLEVVMHPKGGMFGYAKELSSRGEAFDLVNAANGHMAHNGGIAYQFKKDLGSRFEEDTKKLAQRRPEGEVPAGQCITTGAYDYAENQSLGLINCQHIHHVVAPMRRHFNQQEYDKAFKEVFVSLLLAANENGGNTIVSCFIGCAIFGGSGHDMARALHAAYHDSRVTSLSKVPKLILSGWEKPDSETISDDRRVYDDFIQTFEALNAEKPVRLPSIAPAFSSVAGSLSAPRPDSRMSEKVLTNGVTLVRLGIYQELGTYLSLFYSDKSYGVVNSIDRSQLSHDDVAAAIRDMAGEQYTQEMYERLNSNNQSDQEKLGQCITREFEHSGKTAKELAHLKTIHNVLILPPDNLNFGLHLENSIFEIFKEAEQHKIDILVSPLLGCRCDGVNETGEIDVLARAIYAAKFNFKLRYGKEAPDVLLVGRGSVLDEANFLSFEGKWDSLNQPPVSTTLSRTRKESPAGVARASETADVTSAAPRGKTIECGNCGETKAEANSKVVAGTLICSGCLDDFVADGLDFAKMDDKYNAVEYKPFNQRILEAESVPGYPKVGLIKVNLEGKGPEYLGGRKLDVPFKAHPAYFPNNQIGRELVRIFRILHEKKLIYVIDESKTLACLGNSPLIRPDFHNLKVDLTERGCFFRTAVGKKIFFADLDEEGFKKYGVERSFGLTFNVHFKTSLFGPHGYERDDGTIDYDYFGRVLNEIEDIAKARGIRDELGLDNLVALLTSDAIDEGKGGS